MNGPYDVIPSPNSGKPGLEIVNQKDDDAFS